MVERPDVQKVKADQCTFLIKKKTSWVVMELLGPKLQWEQVLLLPKNTWEPIM
jgi:hypothetical protein